jgi:hypothetical protein
MHRASWPTALAVATRYVTVSDSIRDLAVHYTDLGVHGDDLAVHHTDLGVHDGPIWVGAAGLCVVSLCCERGEVTALTSWAAAAQLEAGVARE